MRHWRFHAKRADQIAAELAQHDYRTNVEALEILRELRALQAGLAEQSS